MWRTDFGPLGPQARELGTDLHSAYQAALDKVKLKEKESDASCEWASLNE